MGEMICYCGHDCSRCLTHLATVNGDAGLRERSRKFYAEVMKITLAADEVKCLGGRSDDVMKLCGGCPFRRCCRERGAERCTDCADYPCKTIAEYERKYVNKFNQIEINQNNV